MFDIDFHEKSFIKLHVRKFLLYPKFWIEPNNRIPINLNWKCYKFIKKNKSKIPNTSGIYAFVVRPYYSNFFVTCYLFYTGKTNRTLRQRYNEYLDEQEGKGKPRPKIYEMLNLYRDHIYFYYAEISQGDSIVNACEEKILDTFAPHINSDIPLARIKPELKNLYE